MRKKLNRSEMCAVMTLPAISGLMLHTAVVAEYFSPSAAALAAIPAAAGYWVVMYFCSLTVGSKNVRSTGAAAALQTVLAAALLLFAAERLYLVSQTACKLLMPYTSAVIIALVILATAVVLAVGRVEPCASVCSIILWPVLIILAVILALGGSVYSVNNLLPVNISWGGTALAAVSLLSYLCEGLCAAYICSPNDTHGDFRRAGVRSGIILSVASAACCLLYSLSVPVQSSANESFGLADIARNEQIGSFFQRMEGLMLFITVIAATVSIALSVGCITAVTEQCIGKNKLTRIIVPIVIAAAILCVSLTADFGRYEVMTVLTKVNCCLIVFILATLVASALVRRVWHRRRQVMAVAVAAVIAVSLCGCGDYNETDNSENAVFVSVDRGEKGYTFCFKTLDGKTVVQSGETLETARDKYEQSSAKRLEMMHLSVIAVSDNCADDIISTVIAEIAATNEIKNSATLLVVDGSAEKFLKLDGVDVSTAKLIQNNIADNPRSVTCNVSDVYGNTNCRGTVTAAPAVKVSGGDYAFTGCYLFGADRMLSGEQALAYNIIRGKVSNMSLGEGATASAITRPRLDGNNIVTFNVTLRLSDFEGDTGRLHEEVTDICEPLMQLAEDSGDDIFDVKLLYMKQHALRGDFDEKEWQTALSQLEYRLVLTIH